MTTKNLSLSNLNKIDMEYLDNVDSKVNEIYLKHAAELEKEHEGEIVAIDIIRETIVGIINRKIFLNGLKTSKRAKILSLLEK